MRERPSGWFVYPPIFALIAPGILSHSNIRSQINVTAVTEARRSATKSTRLNFADSSHCPKSF